jgi:error-prone DNA polymerase
VRADEVEALVAARHADGPFRSLDELASRAGAARPALERLAWSGACDALALADAAAASPSAPASARRIALWRLGIAVPAHAAGDDATQLALPVDLPQAPALAAVGDWDAMIADYASTGVTVHRHPLRLLRPGLRERGTVSSADLPRMRHGEPVRIAGLVVARQRPGTAKGVVFLLIEDETGTVNLIVPPAVYERDRLAVRTEPLVLVDGTLERHAAAGGAINVLVRRLVALDAPDLLSERPAATVKDFSPLDERERQRIIAEQPLVAAGGGVAVAAGGGVAVAAGGGVAVAAEGGFSSTGGGDAGGVGGASSAGARSALAAVGTVAAGPSGTRESAGANSAQRVVGGASHDRPTASAPSDPHAAETGEGDVRESGGTDDFRAVAPPVMSFAQGRRR